MTGKVFLNYTQKELDDAYSQPVYAPNREQVLGRYATNSDISRRYLGQPERLAYGPTEIEKLDVFRTKKPNAPINVFIHGGAWRAGSARDYAFHAENFVGAGANLVVLDFNNVLETGGSLTIMADQIRRAVAWVYRNAQKIGGDRSRFYISGTSSGAHFGGVCAATDWNKDHDLPADFVRGYTLCSGMYDLRGPRLSIRSQYVKFTDEMEHALSPQRHLERINAPIVLVYGSLETPEFQRQSRDFAVALEQAGKPVKLIRGEGYNHFEIAETLATPYGIVGRAVLEQMELR
ncbi:MAG: alpha/beta hydrolase [Burkholderiales bacterium]